MKRSYTKMSVKQGVTLDFMSAETFLPVQDLVLNKLIALKSRHVSVRGLLQPSFLAFHLSMPNSANAATFKVAIFILSDGFSENMRIDI